MTLPRHQHEGYEAVSRVIEALDGRPVADVNGVIWRAVEAYRSAAEPAHERQVREDERAKAAEQTSTDPTATAHLRAGDRLTLDELAVHLNAVHVWLRQLAIAAETPDVPVDLGKNLCDELDSMARRLEEAGQKVAELDAIISSRVPLAPTLPDGAPWGARAVDADTPQRSKPAVIPTMWQVLGLARWHQETRALVDLPARPERQRTPSPAAPDGIAYLDGIADVPGLDGWESPRAAERRARDRAALIQVQALQEHCATCEATPGSHCRTKTNRAAETYHRPRITAATKHVDDQDGEADE